MRQPFKTCGSIAAILLFTALLAGAFPFPWGFWKSGSVTSFSPANVAGLVLWLKADSLSLTNGQSISTWNDSSSYANNATASNSPLYYTSQINSKPAVKLNGTNQLFTCAEASSLNITQMSVFAVVRFDGAGIGNGIVLMKKGVDDGNDGKYGLARQSSDNKWLCNVSAGSWADSLSVSTVTNGGWYLLEGTYDSVSALEMYKNASGDGSHTRSGPINTVSPGDLQLGGYRGAFVPGGSEYGNITLAEVLLYNTAISTTNRQQVETYLNSKYAIY